MFISGNGRLVTCCCIVTVIVGFVWKYIWTEPIAYVSEVYTEYDYIVVGGGTAGCVLANRLSENEKSTVLLIEAGDRFSFASKIPIMPTIVQRGPNDWSFTTEPQMFSSFGLIDKIQFLPRGKGLGGTGQLNYLLHGVGIPSDYERWVQMGALNWHYSNIEPYVKNIFGEKAHSNQNIGPIIKLSKIEEELSEISQIFVNSSKELPAHLKMNVEIFKNTIDNGIRQSSFESHLMFAANRRNLHILKNSVVSKIIFKNNEAKAVEILKDGFNQYVNSKKEIILCAGALHTPQILMLSGIGPKLELEKLNIKPLSLLEGVGMNLHDHVNVPLYVSYEKSISMTVNKIMSFKSLFKYLFTGRGYFATSGVVGIGRTEGSAANILFAVGSVDEDLFRHVSNLKSEIFRKLFPFYMDSDKEGSIFLHTCLQSSSRGYVKLKDKNPSNLLIVDPNYLSDIKDIHCLIRAIRLTIEVVKTPTFKKIGTVLHWPMIDDCQHLWQDENQISDSYLECIIRFTVLTAHHVAGTCSMAGNNTVVDSSLMVHGVKKLSIVDASILPTPVSSPPNSAIVVIAERAAQIIKHRNNDS